MSTIIATTLSNGSVSVPTATVVNGSAKAWVNFNGQSAPAAILDSFNLSSLTDVGLGTYTGNTTAAFASANYTMAGSASNDGGGWGEVTQKGEDLSTASAVKVRSVGYANYFDPLRVTFSCHGDLA